MNTKDWIKVTDKLPEHRQQTLIYDMLGITMAVYNKEKGVWITKGQVRLELPPPSIVTHWMPIAFPSEEVELKLIEK